MIRFLFAVLVSALSFSMAVELSGCAVFKSPQAKTVVDLAFAKCVAEAESTDASVVAAICSIGPELYDVLADLLAAKRAGLRKAMARPGACRPAPISSITPSSTLRLAAMDACMADWGYRDVYSVEYAR